MFIEMRNLSDNKAYEKSYLVIENILIASPIACYSSTSNVEPTLVNKKRKLPKTLLHISCLD